MSKSSLAPHSASPSGWDVWPIPTPALQRVPLLLLGDPGELGAAQPGCCRPSPPGAHGPGQGPLRFIPSGSVSLASSWLSVTLPAPGCPSPVPPSITHNGDDVLMFFL